MRFLPAALSFRLDPARRAVMLEVPDFSRIAAHRFLWAAAILFRAAALIALRLRVPFDELPTRLELRPGNIARSS
jgi:hypothetical protein